MIDDRKSNIELPGRAAFMQIVHREAKRRVDPAKIQMHFPKFEVVRDIESSLNISADWLDPPQTLGDPYDRAVWVLKESRPWVEAVAEVGLTKATVDAVYDYLSESDELTKVSYLVVPGSRSLLRPQKAAEIILAGLAGGVVVTGHGPNYRQGDSDPEWKIYYRELLKLGVNPSDILDEPDAITIPDNAFRTLNKLDGIGMYESIGLVTNSWCLRRIWVHFSKMSPDGVKIVRFDAGSSPESSRHEWFKYKDQVKIILNEFPKMRAAIETNTA